MFHKTGLRSFNLNFYEVYDIRRDVGAKLNQGLNAYILSWAVKIFGPLLLITCLEKRKYFICSFIFLLFLFLVWS